MDYASLVNSEIKAGEKLIKYLDTTSFRVVAAFWYYFSETNDWRLVIASPYVAKRGPLASYKFLQSALANLRGPKVLHVTDLIALPVEDPLIQALGQAFRITGISNSRMANITINGTPIENAVVYRLDIHASKSSSDGTPSTQAKVGAT